MFYTHGNKNRMIKNIQSKKDNKGENNKEDWWDK